MANPLLDFMNLIAGRPLGDAGEEDFKRRMAWYTPAELPNVPHAIGNVLGLAGTLVKDPISEGVLAPSLGAFMAGMNRLPGGNRRLFSSEFGSEVPLTEFTREGLREYVRANTEGNGVAEFAAGTLTDPTSYVLGPLGRGARAIEGMAGGVAPLARAAGAIARADEAAQAGAGATLRGAGRLVRHTAEYIPGVRRALDIAPRGQLAEWSSQIGRAVGNLPEWLTPEKLFGGVDEGALTKGPAVWTQLAKRWEGLANEVAELPASAQAAVIGQWKRGAEAKNLIEAREAQIREGIADALRGDVVFDATANQEVVASWRRQSANVFAIQEALNSAIDNVKAMDLPVLDEAGEAAAKEELGRLLTEMQDPQLAARDMARSIDELLGGLGEGAVPRAAEDFYYRAARQQLMDKVTDALPGLARRFEDVGLADDYRGVMEAAAQGFEAATEALQVYAKPLEEALRGIAPDHAKALADNADWLTKAAGSVLAARRAIHRAAVPVLEEYWRTDVDRGLMTAAERADRIAAALTSREELLKVPVWEQPAAQGAKATIEKLLKRFEQHGDVLNHQHMAPLVTNIASERYGRDVLGIKGIPPWFGWAATALESWKSLALLSVRYPVQNLVGILTLSANAGVSPVAIVRQLGREMDLLRRTGHVSDRVTADTFPLLARLRGTRGDGTIDLPAGLLHTQLKEVLPQSVRGPAIGKVPLALRAGVPAAATGYAAYQAGDEQDPNRAWKAAGAGVAAGAFGAATPAFVKASGEVAAAIEKAGRGVAFVTGLERAHPLEARAFAPRIKEVLDTPTAVQTIGQQALRDGVPVTNLAEMVAPDAGRSVLAVPMSRPSPTVTGGREVDWRRVTDFFENAKGAVAPDDLYREAVAAGATDTQAAALRAAWDAAVNRAEQAGIDLSNAINFDYSKSSNLTAFMRDSGLMPFLTWQVKALPLFATILAQNPRYLMAIDRLNTMTEREADEAGLTPQYRRMVGTGALGDFISGLVLGRSDGELFAKPLQALFPYGDVGLAPTAYDNPLEQGLDALGQVGLAPGPLVTLPLMATGAVDQAGSLFRTSPYLEALLGADPELALKQAVRGTRRLMGNEEAEPTRGSNPIKDYAIRQRIVEMQAEEQGTLGPPTGDYRRALDNPESAIWERARRDVERQQAGQTGLNAVLPFQTRFLSDKAREARGAQKEQGVDAASLNARLPAENSAAWRRAAAADPASVAFNGLAGGEEATAKRQLGDYFAFRRRVARMNPTRRAAALRDYLEDKPALRRWIAENPAF